MDIECSTIYQSTDLQRHHRCGKLHKMHVCIHALTMFTSHTLIWELKWKFGTLCMEKILILDEEGQKVDTKYQIIKISVINRCHCRSSLIYLKLQSFFAFFYLAFFGLYASVNDHLVCDIA